MSEGAIYPELVESFVRDELNRTATRFVHVYLCVCVCVRACLVLLISLIFFSRVMAVLEPIKVVITNFPHTSVRTLCCVNCWNLLISVSFYY